MASTDNLTSNNKKDRTRTNANYCDTKIGPNTQQDTQESMLRDMTDRAWFSRLL